MDLNKKSQIVDKIITLYQHGVNLHNITKLVTDLMSYIGNVKGLSGNDKKKEVIDLVVFVIQNTESGPLEYFEPFIIDILPEMIDTLIKVQDGKLRFNPKIKFNCFNK